MANVISFTAACHGASEEQWYQLSLIMDHGADLLPVVSNPKATLSATSTVRSLGKVPSLYNNQREVVGIANWTTKIATPADIERWARERDYGICIQCRDVRALDGDIDDPVKARKIIDAIERVLGFRLPMRTRPNSGKFLLAFRLKGDYPKRMMKVDGGITEFLGNGQQFVALGRHTSGVHYEWQDGFPPAFPTLTPEQFELVWSVLAHEHAIEPPTTDNPSKQKTLSAAIANDPVAGHLIAKKMVKRTERDGRLHIDCPFADQHTTDGGDTATTYWPRMTGGYERGHFHCLHAHCASRSDSDFLDGIGYVPAPVECEFEALADDDGIVTAESDNQDSLIPGSADQETLIPIKKHKYYGYTPAESLHFPKPTWLIKGVLPRADLGVLYGESTAGKTFAALDMALAISRGVAWRGKKTKKARVTYVAAEDDMGVRLRIMAYCIANDIDPASIEMRVIYTSINLMEKADVLDLCRQIMEQGGADLVILDTFAQCVAGANENSGEDMGEALKNCRGITTATKAMVILIHHAGKDLTKGARGWSGLKAAADCEIEVSLFGDNYRLIRVTKLKNGVTGQEFGFELVTLVLAVDEDGEDVTSCFVKPTLVSAARREQPKGKWQIATMAAIREFSQDQNAGIEIAAVIAEVKRTTTKDEDANGKDRRGQFVRQALDALAARNLLQIDDGCVSLCNT